MDKISSEFLSLEEQDVNVQQLKYLQARLKTSNDPAEKSRLQKELDEALKRFRRISSNDDK